MFKSKIDWCDSTWSPVTGCKHGCEYCYARGIATRFGTLFKGDILPEDEGLTFLPDEPERFFELNEPVRNDDGKIEPYPANFYPTFHKYRLNDYVDKKGRNIFVCSMADLFGDWVPLEWQLEVFEACRKAPQHNYIFLTKNPAMYVDMDKQGILPADSNMWFGTSVTKPGDPFPYNGKEKHNLFLSIEPLLADFGVGSDMALKDIGWVIIGAETGCRKDKVVPEKSWIDNIISQCKENNIPVFLKERLRALYGDDLLREFPTGLIHG